MTYYSRWIIAFTGIFLSLSSTHANAFSNPSDCLIENDIGIYNYRPNSSNLGNGSGIVGPTGHFTDHLDNVCSGKYSNIDQIRGLPIDEARQKIISINIQVTQHTGGDSDQWLLHEVEDGYRDSDQLEAVLSEASRLRTINNNIIFFYGGGEVGYSWLSNAVLVNIEYNNFGPAKPEPLEIVQAYLQKFPSTIPATLALNRAHDEQWIKDEMERRLWLGDKWFAWQEAGNSDVAETLREVNRSIEVFLNYREKNFGINADLEKESLYTLISNQNLQGMKDKLAEYKAWWANNKTGSINLP
ncbi:MAG: hypothetical protein KJ950_02210 [Proteobacteria bacterium]|nr:hypothetical protein [Pseudomonadota bacterium]